MSKRILITGISGQIGTNLAYNLIDKGYEIFGIDKRQNTWTSDLTTIHQDLSSRYDNYNQGLGCLDYGKVDLVIHLAANAKVHELVEHPTRALDNFMMTFNMIEYCRTNNIPIIYSSTREVYGDIQRYVTNEEDASFHTTESPYSASKISGEAFLYSYSKCYDLSYICYRFSNVYGRYDNDIERMERVIPLFYNKIKNGEPITIYGEDKVLDFTYIDDCVAGISSGVDKLLSGEVKNKTFNLAHGTGNPLRTVADVFQEELGVEADLSFEPSRLGEVTHYIADISSAKKYLNYDPKTDLVSGLRKAAAWYASQSK
ncbi:NAD-dependent epimerase/dehydratase family protein [Lentisphaera profundi]|uniref:NAD-dependent epimerase/dehydratase family protein n=1 Tax=Lentisphaera profundi TaxID=1658616 RepID=A0ABY7VXC0_9BACT|nr:NAD-dependent epimerase/dehydratase family protein [Lentisphaera profundi]WDE96718.1 NAD-dependent epimerase/dehydratase family protein [Lentisphaera profundi]